MGSRYIEIWKGELRVGDVLPIFDMDAFDLVDKTVAHLNWRDPDEEVDVTFTDGDTLTYGHGLTMEVRT